MKNKPENKQLHTVTFFELLFLAWPGFILLSILTAIGGIFYQQMSWAYLLSVIGGVVFLQKKHKLKIKPPALSEKIALLIISLWIIILSYFTVPTIFGGRDEGLLSTAGFLINREHKLSYHNKLISTFATVEGKALNFPGFFYKKTSQGLELRSQFLPGYSSYLATFANNKNVNALKWANAIPLLIFLLAFYALAKQITSSEKFSLIALFGLMSLTPLALFYKFTLSEIFFASLIWSSLYFLYRYLHLPKKSRNIIDFWFIFLPLLPAIFVRIESLALAFVLILILIVKTDKELHLPKFQTPVLLLILFSVLSLVLFSDFYIATIKGFAESLINISADTGEKNDIASSLIPKMWRDFYIVRIFYIYNLLPLLVFAGVALIKLLKNKSWSALLPFFYLGITGIYLIDANISLDHPWMLRRFVFSILPLLVLYTVLFFYYYPLQRKTIGNLILFIILASNFLLASPFILMKQNDGLLSETASLATNFQDNDLILVSQQSSGSGWSLVSEPLRTVFHKQAIYFFNPNDYVKINPTDWDNIYLLVSDNEIEHYSALLSPKTPAQPYQIQNKLLLPSKNPNRLPSYSQIITKGFIYKLK